MQGLPGHPAAIGVTAGLALGAFFTDDLLLVASRLRRGRPAITTGLAARAQQDPLPLRVTPDRECPVRRHVEAMVPIGCFIE